MKRIEVGAIDKSQWGEGPWQNEPDAVRWTDDDTGYTCLILRGPKEIGHLCGYVGVPSGHPAFGKDYDNVDVDVHGGLTYAGHNAPNQDHDRYYWLGFDCAHAGDLCPAIVAWQHDGYGKDVVYRNLAYVTAECQSLAKQLKAMEK